MPSSLNGIGVTFNDGTQLQSANEAGGNFIQRTFTGPTTWTKPAGLKAVKVTVVGGGGSAVSASPPSGNITGVTGGTSSFGAFASATGGAGGRQIGGDFPTRRQGGGGLGTASGGLEVRGGAGNTASQGGSSIMGGAGTPSAAPDGGFLAGALGSGGSGGTCNGGAGGAAVLSIAAPTIPGPVAVTVGVGGVSPPVSFRAGAAGVVVVEEFY